MLGGTFDPVHRGHVASARDTAAAFDLDRVVLVVSARPPHKTDRRPATPAERLAMVELAVGDDPVLEPSDIEIRRPGLSYTVDTLKALKSEHPGVDLYLILGIDAYLDIDSWYRPEELFHLANVIVTTRPGVDFPEWALISPVAARNSCCYDSAIGSYVHSSGHRLVRHEIDGVEASASEIRRLAASGLPFEHMTFPSVADYIRDRGLYGVARR